MQSPVAKALTQVSKLFETSPKSCHAKSSLHKQIVNQLQDIWDSECSLLKYIEDFLFKDVLLDEHKS